MVAVYEYYLDIMILTTHLELLKVKFSRNFHEEHSIKDIIETVKTFFSKHPRIFFSNNHSFGDFPSYDSYKCS